MVGRNSNVPFLSQIRVGKSLTLKLPNSLYDTLSNCHYISLVSLCRNSFNIQRLASFIFMLAIRETPRRSVIVEIVTTRKHRQVSTDQFLFMYLFIYFLYQEGLVASLNSLTFFLVLINFLTIILRFIGTCLDGGVVNIFMEFVPGGSIASILAR